MRRISKFETSPLASPAATRPMAATKMVDTGPSDFGNPPANAHPASAQPMTVQNASQAASTANSADAGLPSVRPQTSAPLDAGALHASDASLPMLDAAMDADDAGDASLPPEPEPGTPFSPCSAYADCKNGLICTNVLTAATSATATRGYCTAVCTWDGTTTNTCPQPNSGWVKARVRDVDALRARDLRAIAVSEWDELRGNLDAARQRTVVGGV